MLLGQLFKRLFHASLKRPDVCIIARHLLGLVFEFLQRVQLRDDILHNRTGLAAKQQESTLWVLFLQLEKGLNEPSQTNVHSNQNRQYSTVDISCRGSQQRTFGNGGEPMVMVNCLKYWIQ
jgi:hypothetical protein